MINSFLVMKNFLLILFCVLFLWTCGGGGGGSPTESDDGGGDDWFTVNVPVVQDFSFQVNEDESVRFTIPNNGETNEDIDFLVLYTDPSHGKITVNGSQIKVGPYSTRTTDIHGNSMPYVYIDNDAWGDRWYAYATYTPDPDFNGQDTFQYRAYNMGNFPFGDARGRWSSNIGTVTITVNPVDEPIQPTVFGSEHSDQQAFSVQQASDGGYILAGRTWTGNSYDIYVVKTTATGNEEWSSIIGGNYAQIARSVQTTSDGGYILAGGNQSGTNEGMYLVKIDNSGNEEWSKTFGNDGSNCDESAYSVQQTSDGGYIVVGYVDGCSSAYGGEDMYVVKTDASGNEQWSRNFGGADDDRAHSVQQTSDGGYIIAGYTRSYGSGGSDMYIIKIDSSGDFIFASGGGTGGDESAYSVQQTSDGGYILAGGTSVDQNDNTYLLKMDSSGGQEWSQTISGWCNPNLTNSCDDDAYAYSVQQTSDGGYVVVGRTKPSYSTSISQMYVVKTYANGSEEWSQAFGGTYNDYQINSVAHSVQQTSDGGYVVGGYTNLRQSSYKDMYIVKLDAQGNQEF